MTSLCGNWRYMMSPKNNTNKKREGRVQMRFGEQLASHLTPEWRKQYINYEMLKDMIYKAMTGRI